MGTVVSRLISFILLPLYTRYLTPKDYGLLEVIDVTTAMIGIVIAIGITSALSRFYYESDEEKERNTVLSTTYVLYILIALLFAPLLFILSIPLSKLLLTSNDYKYFFRIRDFLNPITN